MGVVRLPGVFVQFCCKERAHIEFLNLSFNEGNWSQSECVELQSNMLVMITIVV